MGEVILQHLVDVPLALSASERYTRYQRIPPGLKPYLDTWDRSFDDWGPAAGWMTVPDGPSSYFVMR